MYRRWLKRTGVGAGEQSAAFGPRMTRPVKSLSQEDFVDHFIVHSDSISFGDELSAFERCLVVVRAFFRTLGQLDLLSRDLLVGDQVQDVRNAVEAGALFVVRTQDVPRRPLVSVASSIMSRAREYSYHLLREGSPWG